eukprot:2353375-Pleurochrysis_carterae.AAC.1
MTQRAACIDGSTREHPDFAPYLPLPLTRRPLSREVGSTAACVEANACRLPHDEQHYRPTYAGRLIHADIAEPFVRTLHHGYQYALVLVNDHTHVSSPYILCVKNQKHLRTSVLHLCIHGTREETRSTPDAHRRYSPQQ